jgi:hypothetical protein
MSAATGLDGLPEPLSLCLDAESARRLVAFQIDPQVLARIEMPGERANEGHLTADERSEYEVLITAHASEMGTLLKALAERHPYSE